MNAIERSTGRALPIVLALVAVGAIVFLLVADPFGGSGGSGGDGVGDDTQTDLLTSGAGDGNDEAERARRNTTATLGGLYGEGQRGAIRLRLLRVGSRSPVAGQPVELLSRRGAQVANTPSDPDGRVMFPQVRPGQGYTIHIKGTGFSEVLLRGISVYPQATIDLGDIALGRDVVLRGRVVDAMGRPVPGTSVSVHTVERRLATKGMLLYLAEQATSVPAALQQVDSDTEGYFAFSSLADGSYSLVARHGGYASRHQPDVIVAHDRGAGVLTLVLGTAGRVWGKVTNADGKPISGAKVIGIRDTGRRMMTRNALQREVAVTDADGNYTIDTLTSTVRYRFGVLADGFAPMYEVQGIEISEADMEKNFTMVPGGDLEGVITDEATGKPVADAQIAVYVGSMGWGNRDPNAKAAADTRRTDKQGTFKFEALTPGPVASAVVKAPGYVTSTFSQWPPPGNAWPAVVAGECQEVKVGLKRGGNIRGVVSAADGDKAPVAGAEVTVMQTGWAAMASMFYGSPSSTTTEDGSFELVGVPPGKYRLVAVADGFTAAGGQEGVEIDVPASGGMVERNLALVSAGVVEGIVRDPAGEPIAGVRIRVKAAPRNNEGGNNSRRSGRRGMDMARRVIMAGRTPADLSNADGRFRLTGIGSDQSWVVYGESDEYVSGESKPFELSPGEIKEIKLTMLPGGALRGRVVDENGRWLAGVRVQVGRLTEDLAGRGRLSSWRADRALDPRVFTTDEEGRFLATNLKPGRALVKASKDDYITFYKRNVTIKPAETVDNYMVALSAGETVEGTVVGADGAPLRRAMVAVTVRRNPGGDDEEQGESDEVEPAMFARTDERGRYKIEHIKPGTYSIVIWTAPGHKGWMRENDEAAIQRDVAVPARDIDFKLTKADPSSEDGGFGGGRGGGRNRGGSNR